MKRLLLIILSIYYIDCFGQNQGFYYTYNIGLDDYIGFFDPETCYDSTIVKLDFSNYTFLASPNGLAIGPNGEFYIFLFDLGSNFLSKVDPITGKVTTVYPITPGLGGNSLVCDAQGIIYLAGINLYSYNTNTGVWTDHGKLPNLASGDLTFRMGKLYCTIDVNTLIEVDISNPMASKKVFKYVLPADYDAWGVVSDVVDCDSTKTYLTVTSTLFSDYEVYLVDFNNQTITYLCDSPHKMNDAAGANEFRASDCTIRIDLDKDDSSGATGRDFQAPLRCGTELLALADTDAVVYSGYRLDSLRVRLLPVLPDGANEYLSAAPGLPNLAVTGQNTPWLTFSNAGNATDDDFLTAIHSVRYHNDAATATPGPRQVAVLAYAGARLSDTAYTRIDLPLLPVAGADSSFAVCRDGTPFDLRDVLSADAQPGGAWWPVPVSGTTVFTPALDATGTYRYRIDGQGCPGDTAVFVIEVLPLPVFSLGPDTAFCAGTRLLLAPAGGANGVLRWQDGTTGLSWLADAPGLYWAEALDIQGCRYRDSVALTQKDTVRIVESLSRCAGDTVLWNGLSWTTDTLVCARFAASNGCDSTHCLSIDFEYAEVEIDTNLCAGQSFSWLGQNLSATGVYTDTVLFGGCLTAMTLRLQIRGPDTTQIVETVCAGQPYLFGGRALFAPGLYQDTFLTANGCDSLVLLELKVHPANALQIKGDTVACADVGVTLRAEGVFSSLQWSTGAPDVQIEVLQSGVYGVTTTDANGCSASDSVAVEVYPMPVAAWEWSGPQCYAGTDGFIRLENVGAGTAPYVFRLNDNAFGSLSAFENLAADQWRVSVQDSAGCVQEYDFVLAEPPVWLLDAGPDPVILPAGASYEIPLQSSQSGPATYAWSPATGLSCADCARPTATPADSVTYRVIATDDNGCATTAQITLIARAVADMFVYIPNAFSPNGDGENDRFVVYADPQRVLQTDVLRVYDRWGGLLFEGKNLLPNDEMAGWNGTARGKNMLPGVYLYYAIIRLATGAELVKTGEVTLLR